MKPLIKLPLPLNVEVNVRRTLDNGDYEYFGVSMLLQYDHTLERLIPRVRQVVETQKQKMIECRAANTLNAEAYEEYMHTIGALLCVCSMSIDWNDHLSQIRLGVEYLSGLHRMEHELVELLGEAVNAEVEECFQDFKCSLFVANATPQQIRDIRFFDTLDLKPELHVGVEPMSLVDIETITHSLH